MESLQLLSARRRQQIWHQQRRHLSARSYWRVGVPPPTQKKAPPSSDTDRLPLGLDMELQVCHCPCSTSNLQAAIRVSTWAQLAGLQGLSRSLACRAKEACAVGVPALPPLHCWREAVHVLTCLTSWPVAAKPIDMAVQEGCCREGERRIQLAYSSPCLPAGACHG